LRRDDWLAVLVGDGESFESLKRVAQELGIDQQVRFVGRVSFEEVTPYIAAMDICAIPDPPNEYTRRCTLIKTMEYMAQSKPIVAFDLEETRFSAQDAAVYVAENDELSFALAIADLMDDADRRRAMGLAGRRRVEAELTWRHSIPHLLSVYAALTAPDSLKTEKHLENVLRGSAGN
jgi:glycosyltransferase involved in cell wall biosynthesis